MKLSFSGAILLLAVVLFGGEVVCADDALPLAGEKPIGKVSIIFDTDMDSDCDDVGALAMLHALADQGRAEILGVMISAGHRWSAPCTQAINAYYGRPDLPIAVPLKPGPHDQGSRYAKELAQSWLAKHEEPARWPVATKLYRQLLAAQPDQSVTIVTVGDLTNLAQLLETRADDFSDLPGPALVEQKVKQWVCMGSRYPADLDPKPWGNFKMDPAATVKAVRDWPTLITFTGGGSFAQLLETGAGLSKLSPDNPCRRAYELYFGGQVQNRHSADQIAVAVAVFGTGKPWKLVRRGHNHIFDDGRHEWRTDEDNPRQQYISALADGSSPELARQVAAEIELYMSRLPASKQ